MKYVLLTIDWKAFAQGAIIPIYFGGCLKVAEMGKEKELNGLRVFLLSFFFTPIIGYLYIASKKV
jgi:hypothetical protein